MFFYVYTLDSTYFERFLSSYDLVEMENINKENFHSILESSWYIDPKLKQINNLKDIILIFFSTMIATNSWIYIRIANIDFIQRKIFNVKAQKIDTKNKLIHSDNYKLTKSLKELIFLLICVGIFTNLVALIRALWSGISLRFYIIFSSGCFLSFLLLNILSKIFDLNDDIYHFRCELLNIKNIENWKINLIIWLLSIIFSIVLSFFGNLLLKEHMKIFFLIWLCLLVIHFCLYIKYSLHPYLPRKYN